MSTGSWIGIAISIVLALLNAIAFCFVRFNDLRHLEIDMKKVQAKLDILIVNVARIEGAHSMQKKVRRIR